MKTSIVSSCVVASLALFGGSCTTSKPQASKPQLQTTGSWTPKWTVTPSPAGYYINSVAVSGNGGRSVAGTFFHQYSSGADTAEAAKAAAPDGQSGTFGTYCYDSMGNLLWKDEFTAWQGVYWVDISNDGAWAAAGGWMTQTPATGFVRVYNAVSGTTLATFSTTARVNQVCLSADGTWLVSAANTLMLFQRVNGTYQKVDEYKPTGYDTMETIALSGDGQTLVAGDYAGNILLFSTTGGKFSAPVSWSLGGGYSHSVRITPNGKYFAAGGSSGNFYFFDTAAFRASPAPTVTYNVPGAGSVYGVAVAADGSAFAGIVNVSGGTGCVYYIGRQGTTGTLNWTYATAHNPNSICINAAFGLVAVADGHPDGTPGAFYLLNSTTGALLGQYGTSNMSWPITISTDGSAVLAGSDNSNVYYFNPPMPLK